MEDRQTKVSVDTPQRWIWKSNTSAEEVHQLLCESDAFSATPEAPPPIRNIETTRQRVLAGTVHVLHAGEQALAMFTLSGDPPFGMKLEVYPAARNPVYLSRLAVKPAWMASASLLGARCLRHAVELANAMGADVIRAEANPDLTRVRSLLSLFGFQQYGEACSEDGRRRVFLQKVLAQSASVAGGRTAT